MILRYLRTDYELTLGKVMTSQLCRVAATSPPIASLRRSTAKPIARSLTWRLKHATFGLSTPESGLSIGQKNKKNMLCTHIGVYIYIYTIICVVCVFSDSGIVVWGIGRFPFYWWLNLVWLWAKKRPWISRIKEMDPWRMDSGDSFFDQFVAVPGVSCSVVPGLPATPEIGEVTPCWKSNLDSTPAVYQCACTTYFASCSPHAGNCTKITDPAILWQQAQQFNGDNMVFFWCCLGASIFCLLPFLCFILWRLWRCFGRSKGTEIVPEE